jgi:TfoX/Sxy family transcriptional regulator of competence genes
VAYDEALADRIRQRLEPVPGVTERKMFGGLAFMVAGNMALGPVGEHLLVRVGPEGYEAALARPEAAEMSFTGRTMRGFVQVAAADLTDDALLDEWVERGVEFALSLPPK